MEDVLITRRDAARRLALKPQTLAKWSMTGRILPVVRIGGRTVRYRLHDVERLVSQGTCDGNQAVTI
jgi:hypothetical protein